MLQSPDQFQEKPKNKNQNFYDIDSLVEQKEITEEALLHKISEVLQIPVVAFQNFDEEQAINIISNTVNNSDHASGNSLFSYYPTVNPIENGLKLWKRLNG
ncbi:hypothetical protein MKJ01_13820 [Chryseobacterium sp. SSA4.19]|uniref:hypothetical protein n=1 Tax=Chryseobacterium sp. SSA4.19 TaxID=2919915 RepID=UPI001F4F04ED|nr:hypothetical protein [Chryseobacterium sp. SSA4.19]MCJ8154845.1 hypothetical protein [Chryseobacterium sp. SSA4.19]